MKDDLLYLIALKKIPLIGDITAKKLIAQFGSARDIFAQRKSSLEKVMGIGSKIARNICNAQYLQEAEAELLFVEKEGIEVVCYTDSHYPVLLKQCVDSPILYYQRGNIHLENKRLLSIVGTRNITHYGSTFCEELVGELASLDVVIVSGFAYGVDITAHKAAIKHNLQTVACLAHGFNTLYPQAHSKYCSAMEENGGFITDFSSSSAFDRKNFLSRNRIIAGLSEATVVIESGKKGGSLVTADIAFSYNREVFAVPGRTTDPYSAGCNALIRWQKARVATCAQDIIDVLKWQAPVRKEVQVSLFVTLTEEEEKVYNYLKANGRQDLDTLALECQIPIYQLSNLLFQMEIKGVVKPLPGKLFELI